MLGSPWYSDNMRQNSRVRIESIQYYMNCTHAYVFFSNQNYLDHCKPGCGCWGRDWREPACMLKARRVITDRHRSWLAILWFSAANDPSPNFSKYLLLCHKLSRRTLSPHQVLIHNWAQNSKISQNVNRHKKGESERDTNSGILRRAVGETNINYVTDKNGWRSWTFSAVITFGLFPGIPPSPWVASPLFPLVLLPSIPPQDSSCPDLDLLPSS